MAKILDITGKKYGQLLVVNLNHSDGRRTYWNCLCDCGKETIKTLDSLRFGTVSCGCHRKVSHFKHGYTKSSTYNIWATMKARCGNPKSPSYERYGGRGIYVCERWNKFDNFLADMGERPYGLSLERKDNSKPYEPSNCIWADKLTQANNTSGNHFITVGGTRKTVAEWSRTIKRNCSTVRRWCDQGIEQEKIQELLLNPHAYRQKDRTR